MSADVIATTHSTKVATVTRHVHDLPRTIHVVRCTCKWRIEHLDADRARRDGARHEAEMNRRVSA